MKQLSQDEKIKINYFQRKPRKGFSFSIEFIFNDVRRKLADKIQYKTIVSSCYNNGYLSKIINIIEAAFRQGKDVNHITGEVHFLNILMRKKRVILTIHDCGMVHRKTGISKNIIQWLYLVAPAKKARIITANSEVTKQEILSFTKINPEKIKVIPVAINEVFQPNPKKFNQEKPVILQIGTGYNKNIGRLIAAIKGISCKLCIVGELPAELVSTLIEAEIDYQNKYNLSENEMVAVYNDCDILSFVSTFEGFGMPIVEANAVERVVITSNLSSMPEVAGNAALFVNPYSVDEIRAGILRLINDENLRRDLISKGRINKLRFEGVKIANMYYKLYQKIRWSTE